MHKIRTREFVCRACLLEKPAPGGFFCVQERAPHVGTKWNSGTPPIWGTPTYFASHKPAPNGYTPAQERSSLYKEIWSTFWPEFRSVYMSRFRERFGPLNPRRIHEVERLLGCGKFANGFVKHECPNCRTILLIPFSCKSRLCLSCHRKKLFSWSLNLSRILEPSFLHSHITFTMPGRLGHLLLRRRFDPQTLAKIASNAYSRLFVRLDQNFSASWMPAILATVHRCGNSLNPNPHVHMIASKELVNRYSGELKSVAYLNYPALRKLWMESLCRHLVRQHALTPEESKTVRKKFPAGFHVNFQTLKRGDGDTVFRTAEYLADGYFHNSQIIRMDWDKRRITFKHKSWVNARTGHKKFSTVTLDVFEFMARMLFYLPGRHEKTVRYYGIYAQSKRRGLSIQSGSTWQIAIKHCFKKDPQSCPDCGETMNAIVVFSLFADRSCAESAPAITWKPAISDADRPEGWELPSRQIFYID